MCRLEPKEIYFPPSFIQSTATFSLKIYNESNKKINYNWKIFESEAAEKALLEKESIQNADGRQKMQEILQFSDTIFTPVPLKGEIWPKRNETVSFLFKPKVSQSYNQTLYLDIGSDRPRIPLEIHGNGLPPEACFNVESVNVGHLSLDTENKYKVELFNSGKVPVDFTYVPHETTQANFTFSPCEGHIEIGEKCEIEVTVSSKKIGNFNETFVFNIRGATKQQPTITFTGRVDNPIIHISKKLITFGEVSYGFLYSDTFVIENKSDIPFDFSLKFHQNTSFSPREFSIKPDCGTVQKYSSQEIKVEFVPISVQEYSEDLIVSVSKVDDVFAKIKVTGRCISPTVSVIDNTVAFGNVFINYPYKETFSFIDHTSLPAKYELCVQDPGQKLANVKITKSNGVIGADEQIDVEVEITPLILGPISIPCYLKIVSSTENIIPWIITAVSVGPTIEVGYKAINFGTIPVLIDKTITNTITNTSLIPVVYSSQILSDSTSFNIGNREGVIQPGEKGSISVIANLDDTVAFTGKLVINIEHLNPVNIPITATGSGTPMDPSIPMEEINFGYILNEVHSKINFTIANKGRRQQELRWSPTKPKINDEAAKTFSLTMTPEVVTIQPHESVNFTLNVHCSESGSFVGGFICNATIGRQRVELFKPNIKGIIIKPQLLFSSKMLEFEHLHDYRKEEKIQESSTELLLQPSEILLPEQSQFLEVTNTNKIPLQLNLVSQEPFIITPSEIELQPNQKEQIKVVFFTPFKKDFFSEVVTRKLMFNIPGHPTNRLFVTLKANYNFPNLMFEPSQDVNFGNMMVNTEESKDIVMRSTSKSPVEWYWELISDDQELNSIFDVFPTRGIMKAEEQDKVHFSFTANGTPDGGSKKYTGKAVCHVLGGPDYVINLTGNAVCIQYSCAPSEIDFGNKIYNETLTTSVVLTNSSDMPVFYSTKIPKSTQFSNFQVTPPEGQIQVNENVTLTVTVSCGRPGLFNEYFLVQIGHFEEKKISIAVNSFFPQVLFDLPRHSTDPALVANPNGTDDELLLTEANLATDKTNDKLGALLRRKDHANEVKAVARYSFDAGQIIVGDEKEFPIKVISKIPFPITITTNEDTIKGTGFTVKNPSLIVEKDVEKEFCILFDTQKRTNNATGIVSHEINLHVGDTLVVIMLTAEIIQPVFTLSKKHFNFNSVIVGQSKTMTLQLQNMNTFPCDFAFSQAEPVQEKKKFVVPGTNKKQKFKKEKTEVAEEEEDSSELEKYVFVTNPSKGTLPPSSFLNIEVIFTPLEGKQYNFNLPLKVKHNTEPETVALSGVGSQLRIEFDPPSLVLPPVLPFSEPSQADITLFNPMDTPIDVFSYNFDYDLYVKSIIQPNKEAPSQDVDKQALTNVSKFSICAIVHGPSKCGRTTVSKIVSEYLNVPIINLVELWAPLLEGKGTAAADLTAAFCSRILEPDCAEGFVIDGLDVLNNTNDTESYMVQCIKQKGCVDEAVFNPFNPIPHPNPTFVEQALNIVINALDGHYIFFIGVKCPISVINERIENEERAEKKEKALKRQAEKEALFSMTEEEYNLLSPEEQEEVDRKRKAIRKRFLKAEMEPQSTSRSTKSHSGKHEHKKHSSHGKDDDGKKKEKSKDEKAKEEEPKKEKKAKSKKGLPLDPLELSALLFTLTVGSLTSKIKTSTDNFQAINPDALKANKTNDSEKISSNASPREEVEEKVVEVKVPKDKPIPLQRNKSQIPSPTKTPADIPSKSFNSLIIDSSETIEEISSKVSGFIPRLQTIKEAAFTNLIPENTIEKSQDTEEPVSKFKDANSFFSIFNEDPFTDLPDIPQPEEENTGRKSVKGYKSKKKQEHIKPDVDVTKLTPVWHIEPNSSKVITVKFSPTTLGTFKTDLLFGIKDCKCPVFQLPASGICSSPNVDRGISAFITDRQLYCKELREFQFGPILIMKDIKKGAASPYTENFIMKNTSQFPAEVSAFFNDNTVKGLWVVEPASAVVPAGESTIFTVSLFPVNVDPIFNTLAFFIKDQPDPLFIKMSAEPCIPSIKISTTALDFDKTLLSKSRTLTFEVKNTSKLSTYWCLKGVSALGEGIKFSTTEGIIKPQKSTMVKAVFMSPKPLVIKKSITLETFDKDKSRNFNSTPISVVGEAFDVLLDLQYPKGMDHLNFGNFTLSQTKTIACTLKNKGKFPIAYKITIDQLTSSIISVAPESGIINSSDKPLTVTFTLKSKNVISFENAKGIKITITDCQTNAVTGVLPLPFSCETVYSMFSITPRKLSYDYISINQSSTKQFSINNDGKFAFDYELVPKTDENVSDKNKKNQAQQKPKTKKSGPHIIVGQFVVSPSSGSIAPGQSMTIDAEFNSAVAGNFKNRFTVNIDEMDPSIDKPSILLQAISEVPGIDIKNFDKIFPELPLNLSCEKRKEDKNCFFEDQQVLHFGALVLQTRSSVTVSIVNPFHVTASVDLAIKPPKASQAKNFPFELSDKTLTVEPLSSQQFTISFQPNIADNFFGIFEAVVKGSNSDNRALRFNVEGIGSLPTFVINGLDHGKGTTYTGSVGRVLLGFKKEKTISIQNNGCLVSHIMFTKKPTTDFVITPELDEVFIKPNESINITAVFQPKSVHRESCDFSVSVENNPKCVGNVSLSGEGISEDLIFEGLSNDDNSIEFKNCVVGSQNQIEFLMKNIGSDTIKFIWQKINEIKFLPAVGHIRVGQSKKIVASFFTDHPVKLNQLKANCQTMKIQLQPHSYNWDDSMKTVKFVKKSSLQPAQPEPLHASKLPPLKEKRGAKSQAAMRKSPHELAVQIAEKHQTMDEVVRVVEIKPEPAFTVLQGKSKDVSLHIVAIADVIKYSIDTTEIAFSPTMMYQTRVVDVKLTNTSQIKFEYSWRLFEFKSIRTDYNLTHQPPFVVEPAQGFVEPGQTAVIQFKFIPEEVDDFIGRFRCDIPFLAAESPIVTVSGLSRRPLCYFNAETSDYLSRRHPDFTYKLPSDIHVIEVFSSGQGQKAVVKFDVTNTTASPYEFMWTNNNEATVPITCSTPCGIISGGKRTVMAFTYIPVTIKTVEALFEFNIPSNGIRVPFLIVGRIDPR